MAILNIRIDGDPILTKKCREVEEVTERIDTLIDDMLETMYEKEGVGLAAPQVGQLKRIVVIDIGEGPTVMINPQIISSEGEQRGSEGCLSLPGKAAIVFRPKKVKVKAFDREMKEFELEAEDLLARAVCHELDHLDGHMYMEKADGPVMDVDELLRLEEERNKAEAEEE